jgi:aminopeptidase N
VWWMLRDMLGETALRKALASYRSDEDREAAYLPRLLEGQAQRDLEWFFDDWVYRDRGLPDFRVQSVYPRQTLPDGYMVTVSIENLGSAGAEVPVILKTQEGDLTKRLQVRGKATTSVRFQVLHLPTEVVVNDGSVPESDMSNNIFEVRTPVR